MSCPKCNEDQYSLMDKKYVELFDVCWSCDNKRFQTKKLLLADFEIKEKHALDESLK